MIEFNASDILNSKLKVSVQDLGDGFYFSISGVDEDGRAIFENFITYDVDGFVDFCKKVVEAYK